MIYVENVSAKQKKKKNNTRFFSEKKNPLRQDGYTKKARERKKIAHGLGVPAFVKSPPNTPPLAARLFIIKRRATPSGKSARLFIYIAKKDFSKASQRNLIKRRVRAIFRVTAKKFAGDSFYIYIKPGGKLLFKEIKAEIESYIKKTQKQ